MGSMLGVLSVAGVAEMDVGRVRNFGRSLTITTNDAHLAQNGDRAAFGRLMDAHLPMAFRLSVRWLGSAEEAKYVSQEAFVKAWEHLRSYDPDRPFAAWLTTIVTRLCLDRLRRRQRSPFQWFRTGDDTTPDPADKRPDPLEALVSTDLASIVVGLLKRLPPTQRIVFALRDLEDLDVEDVADVTGISASSVKANLSYARRTIRTILAEEYHLKGLTV